VLRRISETGGRRFDPEPLLQTAVAEVGAALATSRCFFYQVDSAGFVRMTHEYVSDAIQAIGVGTEILTPATYLARQTAQTVKTDDTQTDSRFGEAMNKQMFIDLSVKSALVTPVIFQETMFGLLGVHQCDRARPWSDDDVELIETVSSLLSMFMQSCRVFADQESQADVLARMNEDLSRLYVELAAKDAQIDKFMHLISHDLRAPVVAIQGLVDLLKKGYENSPPDSKPRRFLELILHSAEQITQLTSALLEYARLGQSSLSIAEVDTEALVRDIWQRLSITVPESELAVFGALPVVQADHSKLTQIFQNLLENAIKYRNQEVRLMVDVTCQETVDHWQFAVNDNGMGFHPNDAELLFDLFARLEQVRSKPGSGIGLASVMEIARLHGGTAWAVGRPGKGSTFYFSLSKKIIARPAFVAAKT
jgi:signal transduction histidine kinase